MNELLKSADPNLSDEDIDRAVGLLWVNAFACSNGGGQVPTFDDCGDHEMPMDDHDDHYDHEIMTDDCG